MKRLTDEKQAKVEAGDVLANYRLLFATIRQYLQQGSIPEALHLLESLEDGVMNQQAVNSRLAPMLRALRYTNEVRAALEAGAARTVPGVQAFQRKKRSTPMAADTILRALRDLDAYVPSKRGRPHKKKN